MSGLIACKNCRQQKVRCSGRSEDGDPCDRCSRRNLECVVDNNYKRTVKRKAIEALEAEISELKRKLISTSRPNSQGSSKQLTPARFEPPRNLSRAKDGDSLRSSAPIYEVETWFCLPKTTQAAGRDPVILESAVIELLFREYVSYYHRVLPVVEIHRGPEFVYSASPALFWTIMAIASRRISKELPSDVSFERLCDAQKHHLSEIAVSPVLGQGKSSKFNLPSLYAVQAFLLCTLWPPPTASFNADMSWNTSGIAKLTAIRAGLHCPGHGHDFERIFRSNKAHRTNLREQLVTWLATNALGQAIANMFGYPSSTNFQAHRQYLFNNVDLPPRVRHMYEIQRNAHEIELSLGQLGQGDYSPSLEVSMASSLIRVHAARYDQIEAEFGEEMDAWTLFTLHAGRAQLFSYYLFGDVDENGVLALYNSCLSLLHHVSIQADEYVKYLPVVSIMILWQTASVVARLYHSKWSDNLDKVSGERLFSKVVKKIGLSSVFEHDLPYRASEILTQMWGAFSAMRRAKHNEPIPLTLSLRSRMSASVFFDSLWKLRESSEIRSQAPTNLTKPTFRADSAEDQRTSAERASVSTSASHSASASSASASATSTDTEQMKMGGPTIPPPVSPHNSGEIPYSQDGIAIPNGGPPPPVDPLHQPIAQNSSSASIVPPLGPYTSQWVQRQLPTINSLLSPDPGTPGLPIKSPATPVSPAMSAMIDPSWADMGPEAASAIWHDVNAVMEDFGFGLGELPYISP